MRIGRREVVKKIESAIEKIIEITKMIGWTIMLLNAILAAVCIVLIIIYTVKITIWFTCLPFEC